MSKFNEKSKREKVINHEGETVFKNTLEEALINGVLTSFVKEPKLYGDNTSDIIDVIRKSIDKNPMFVAKLGIYAREQFYMRSITHIIAAELANRVKGQEFVKKAITRIIKRPDDMTEILSYYIQTFGKPIPNSLKKGLASAFASFGEYSLSKYNRKQEVELKDILLLTHPKPSTKEESDMWKRLIEGKLTVPQTWETQISLRGNTKEAWEDLIENRNIPYMAMLRNLRNIIKNDVDNLDIVLGYISNENIIKNSKQFPYRFFSAYKALEEDNLLTNKVHNALDKAIEASIKNLQPLSGKTLILTDVSGSMRSQLSMRTNIRYKDVAILIATMANKIMEDARIGLFATFYKEVFLPNKNSFFSNHDLLSNHFVGGGTILKVAFDKITSNNEYYDRIIILSDMQVFSRNRSSTNLISNYQNQVNPNVKIYSIDMAGYGNSFMNTYDKNIYTLAGWSDKIFELIYLMEKGSSSIYEEIEKEIKII